MKDMSFNKGIEFWFAHYYDNLSMRFPNTSTVDKFGNFFCDRLNSEKARETFCLSIGKILDENFIRFKEMDDFRFDPKCFVEEPIKYVDEFKYIKFPDFKDDEFDKFVLRLDINPCVGTENNMTKIYCISSYLGSVHKEEVIDFFHRAQMVCEAVIQILTKNYLNIFNEFIETYHYPNMGKINDKQMNLPYRLISRMVGSKDENTKEFISLLDSPDKWRIFCKKNQKAKLILEILAEMNKSVKRAWKIADYKWFRQKVQYEENNSSSNKVRKALGYIGFKGNENFGHLIGITDSFPRDILLPLNLEFIHAR